MAEKKRRQKFPALAQGNAYKIKKVAETKKQSGSLVPTKKMPDFGGSGAAAGGPAAPP